MCSGPLDIFVASFPTSTARQTRSSKQDVAVDVGIQALDTPEHIVDAFKKDFNDMLRKCERPVKVAWVQPQAKMNLLLCMPGQRLLPSRVLHHLRKGTATVIHSS